MQILVIDQIERTHYRSSKKQIELIEENHSRTHQHHKQQKTHLRKKKALHIQLRNLMFDFFLMCSCS